jgi:hypothetical protein
LVHEPWKLRGLERIALGDCPEPVAELADGRGFRPERGTIGGWIVGITRRGIADALSARTRRLHLVAAAGPALALADPAAQRPDATLDRALGLRDLARLPAPPAGRTTGWPLGKGQESRPTRAPPAAPRSPARRTG